MQQEKSIEYITQSTLAALENALSVITAYKESKLSERVKKFKSNVNKKKRVILKELNQSKRVNINHKDNRQTKSQKIDSVEEIIKCKL
jgi:acetyl-CoA carboxylase alpha subunit